MDSGEKVDFHRRFRGATRRSGLNKGKLDSQVQPHQPPIRCPECSSERVWRDGIRTTSHGDVQRYLCRSCGLRFSESTAEFQVKVDVPSQRFKMFNSGSGVSKRPVCEAEFSIKEASDGFSLSLSENVSSHDASKIASEGKSLKVFRPYTSNCRVSVSEVEAKNLVKVESRILKRAAGATKLDSAATKGKIIEFAWWMKKEGYAEPTIRNYSGLVKTLAKRGADLTNPESVKEVIAKQKWSEGHKSLAVSSYSMFLKAFGGTWKPPKYRIKRKIPFIPTEEEINALIASCGKKTSTFLQLLKETGMRLGEADSLKWTDIDMERRVIILNDPEKGSEPRIFKVSTKLIDMLNALPRKNERVFGTSSRSAKKKVFYLQRKRAAEKLKNPRLLKITFHTFRHWKATILYHQTKDIIYVQKFLGHKKIENTMLYIQIAETLFKETTDEFTVRVANKPEGIRGLLEAGFEYVCEKDGLLFFRKRK